MTSIGGCPRLIARKVLGAIARARRLPPLRDVCWGKDFPDKRFLLIRRDDTVAGLFSYFVTDLGWVKYAEDHGMIPVIDMGHYRNVYLTWREFLFTKTNAWDFFFEQPGGFSVRDIRRARNVTIAEGVPPGGVDYPSPRTCFNPENADRLCGWIETAHRTMCAHEDVLKPYVNNLFESVVEQGVIGVLARGTDYTQFRPHGHPVQPTVEQLAAAIDEYSKRGHEGERIYLVTEDASVARAFQNRYGDRLILSRQSFVDYRGGWLCENSCVNHNRERGYAYLKAIVDLSRCTSIFAGRTSGAVGAFLLSKGFQKAVFFDLGLYP